MKIFSRFSIFHLSSNFLTLYVLHYLNDGFDASFILLLPFIAKELHLSLTQVGFVGTLSNSLSVILALPAGYIATKIGGIKTLVLALFVYGLAYIGTGFSPNYFWILLVFILGGVGFGVFHTIGFALIARWSIKEERGKQMGNFTAIGDTGKISLTAVLTFIIILIGWRYTSMLYGIVAIIAAVFISFIIFSRKEHFVTKAQQTKEINFVEILKHTKFLFATITGFFDCLASSSLFMFLPFLLLKRGVSPAFLGSFAATFFIGNFIGKLVLGRFTDKYGTSKVFITAEILMGLFIFLFANTSSFLLIIIFSIILGIFTKGTVAVTNTMVSEASEHHGNFEKAFGVNEFITSIGTTIAPLILGLLSDKFGIVSAFYAMGIAAIIAAIPAYFFYKTK